MKFVKDFGRVEKEIKFTMYYTDKEVELRASDAEGEETPIIGIRYDGTVVRYVGLQTMLERLGFQTELDERGNGDSLVVKMFN